MEETNRLSGSAAAVDQVQGRMPSSSSSSTSSSNQFPSQHLSVDQRNEQLNPITDTDLLISINTSLNRRSNSSESKNNSEHENMECESISHQEYEGLNYELCENELVRLAEKHPAYQRQLFRQNLNRWLICLLIGVCTALIACGIDILVYYSTRIKFELVLGQLFNWATERNCAFLGLLAWVGLNCAFVLVAASLVVFWAGPIAAGSGIPQIKCFLNGVMIPGVVRLKTLMAKSIGVAFSVAGGLFVGKEGPMIHSGAAVAAGISQGRCVTIPADFKIFEYFRNDREKRDFVSVGAAAGVAAAFGAPIGGVLFSLEEGASFWNQSLTWRMFFASMISSFTLSVVLSVFYGRTGYLSWSGLANFGTFDFELDYNIWEMLLFVVIGVLGGLSGALFNHANIKLTVLRQKYLHSKWQQMLEAILVAAMSAVVCFMLVYTVGDCRHLAGANVTVPVQLWCADGQYNALAELFFHSPEESVKQLFHRPPDTYSALTLLCFACVCWCLSMCTYGLSVPSGLFIPSLLTGAAWGRLIGLAVYYLFPNANGLEIMKPYIVVALPRLNLEISVHPGKYALAGAAAQLGGIVRMTISLCAIIMEATRGVTFGLPIMLILMVAKWVGDLFNEGLYDLHIEHNKVPLLGWEAPKPAAHITAQRIMHSAVRVLHEQCLVSEIHALLQNTAHNAFAVVGEGDNEGRLKGLILRSQLIVLLKNRQFTLERNDISTVVPGSLPISLRSFQYTPRLKLSAAQLSNGDLQCWLDLRPYMNVQPHRVPLEATLNSMYHLMRGLGLRHVLVVDHLNMVQGIVTRKDIARFREVRTGWTQIVQEVEHH